MPGQVASLPDLFNAGPVSAATSHPLTVPPSRQRTPPPPVFSLLRFPIHFDARHTSTAACPLSTSTTQKLIAQLERAKPGPHEQVVAAARQLYTNEPYLAWSRCSHTNTGTVLSRSQRATDSTNTSARLRSIIIPNRVMHTDMARPSCAPVRALARCGRHADRAVYAEVDIKMRGTNCINSSGVDGRRAGECVVHV